MSRRVAVTGLGVLSHAGMGVEALWDAVLASQSGMQRISAFDPSGFTCQVAAEVTDFRANKIVPKHYRKATKVMARDIELAMGAADAAVRDAQLMTPAIDADQAPSYAGHRIGAHIGAGLIAAELDELTSALVEAVDEQGQFDLRKWGASGMSHLTPLWLLKYLPNMLACHVTIVHGAQGPSNTITCAQASSGLSIGESFRCITRGMADACFCGGAESKLNPMAYYRQQLTGRLTASSNDQPQQAIKPYDTQADGTALGEGGGILILEAVESANQRQVPIHAELVGFAASHGVNPLSGGLRPEPQGLAIEQAMRRALEDAGIDAGAVDAVVGFGCGEPEFDAAEARAITRLFGERAGEVPIWSATPYVGDCGAGIGGMAAALAVKMLQTQTLPPRINCATPIEGLNAASGDAQSLAMEHVLVTQSSLAGQTCALVFKKAGE